MMKCRALIRALALTIGAAGCVGFERDSSGMVAPSGGSPSGMRVIFKEVFPANAVADSGISD
jgi:hypothetical protein